jgi:hypothetical protein
VAGLTAHVEEMYTERNLIQKKPTNRQTQRREIKRQQTGKKTKKQTTHIHTH